MASPGLAAEPRHQLGATAHGPEQEREKPEGTMLARHLAPAREGFAGALRRRVVAGRVPFERRQQRFVVVPIGRDADQVVVGETDEGRFQRRREGQVVVGQQAPRVPPPPDP